MSNNNPAFDVKVDLSRGETIIVLKNSILGAISHQLMETTNRRRGHTILRKLGHTLSDCGDLQYGKRTIEDTQIDPKKVVYESEISNS
ncbi:MAG: hypothetical protein JSW11_00930 [Candidatus Heimdallarchaeota archaeon]|nr:MAG: hypothetical protein JSW11_00930 [Candidatus Heimdallarchaeota archaeon]